MAAQQRNGASSQSLEMANSNQELVTRASARRWRCLLLVLGLALGLGIFVAVLVVVLSGQDEGPPLGQDYLTLDDVLKRKFSPRPFNASWVSGNLLYFDDAATGQPYLFDVETRTRRSPFGDTLIALDPQAFQTTPSADKKYILEAYFYRALYRHSYSAFYNIIDVATGEKFPLTLPGQGNFSALAQLVVWGEQGSELVMVVNNDIYYRPTATHSGIRITNTGRPDTIYNGVPDWVYEEEVLASNKALWFSPDGSRLAYVTFNDTTTPYMTLPYYGRPGDIASQYTRAYSIRYPKPNAPNPVVSLAVANLRSPDQPHLDVPPPPELRSSSPVDTPILAMARWLPHPSLPRLLIVWMNRTQNHAIIQMCTVSDTVQCGTVLNLKEPAGWVDLFEGAVGELDSNASARLLLPLSHPVGNDSFRHVARFDPNEDLSTFARTDLTNGTFVVTSILGWDSVGGYVYFVSTAADDPAVALVQRVKDSPEGAPHEAECLSCNVPNCTYASATMSTDLSHLALTCSGPAVPFTLILSTKNTSRMFDWERNEAVRSVLEKKTLSKKRRMTVPLPDGMQAQVMLWLPPGMDESGSTKYPMLVDVYGGPNSFRVSEKFAMDWGTYLSANQSIIYAAIDGRGSANKGDRMVFSLYRRFGTVEVEDQIKVTSYLQRTLPYIDASRTAIWGWSYGGYASAMALSKDKGGVFKCGISVAPVTDWIYYDSIYTERYMGLPTPSDNLKGYVDAQLNNKVENIANKKFLLVHGTLDDNVHYQQSMMLSRALEEKDILFRQQSYPDEEHGLVNLQPHLYHTLQNFLRECFEI